jgi:acyl-homoserine-lactone acylase
MNVREKSLRAFRRYLFVAGLILLSFGRQICRAQSPRARSSGSRYGTATVYRDHYGVPHIYGPTDASVIYASAWVEANDDWPLVGDNFLRSIGRGAEFHGEQALGDDYLDRALQIPQLARAEYLHKSPRMRSLLDAYAAGFNDWLAAHPDKKHRLAHVEPWYTLAMLRFKYDELEFLGDSGFHKSMEEALLKHGWPVGGRDTAAIAGNGKDFEDGSITRFAENIHGPLGDTPIGSNEWAVGPSRTADGHAMLLINPHQSFFGIQRYFEIDLHSEEGLVFSGITRFGYLLPYMGNNHHLGWTFTDNYPDIGDLYVEKFDEPQHPLAYRYGNGHRQAKTWTETVKVKASHGTEERTLRFWATLHGPIIGLDKHHRPLAVRLAKLKTGGWGDQLYAMIRAHSLDAFRQAESKLDIPYMNLMYADDKGNIWYVYNGAVPKRDPAFDWRKPVDGSNPKTEWHGYHKLSELPQVLNPKSGFLLNTNSSPMFATDSVSYKRTDFPPYMIGNEPNNWRARSSRRALENLHHVTFDEFARDVWNTRLALADDILPEIQAEWGELKQANPATVPVSLRPGTREYKDLQYVVGQFSKWDRVARIESVPTTWFIQSFELWSGMRASGHAGKWSRLVALAKVIRALRQRWGTIEVPWGEVNRLQRPPEDDPKYFSDALPSLPVGGAPSAVFAFYPLLTRNSKKWWMGPGRVYGTAGNTFVKVVDFGPQIRASSVIEFGESADPKSPHYFDQAPLYAERMFKPAWSSLKQVKAHAEKVYRPGKH